MKTEIVDMTDDVMRELVLFTKQTATRDKIMSLMKEKEIRVMIDKSDYRYWYEKPYTMYGIEYHAPKYMVRYLDRVISNRYQDMKYKYGDD